VRGVVTWDVGGGVEGEMRFGGLNGRGKREERTERGGKGGGELCGRESVGGGRKEKGGGGSKRGIKKVGGGEGRDRDRGWAERLIVGDSESIEVNARVRGEGGAEGAGRAG